MVQQIILGLIQGIGEWLPVSSSGLLVLAQTQLFGQTNLPEMIKLALFLHLGTFIAALIYFRQEIFELFKPEKKKIRSFLIVSTLVSGGLGYLLLKVVAGFESSFEITGKVVTVLIGLLLIITGILQLRKNKEGNRQMENLDIKDSLLFGLAQGLAVLPGFSRSGLTIAVLLFRNVEKYSALKVSFLGGLPIIFVGNILLNVNKICLENGYLLGMGVAFVVGMLTIHLLLKLAKKTNFGYFIITFGIITLFSSFI